MTKVCKAPPTMRQLLGRKDCVLFGQHYIVLKRMEGIGVRTCFEVLGDAYIDEYMNGEGMQEVKDGQIQLTECVII